MVLTDPPLRIRPPHFDLFTKVSNVIFSEEKSYTSYSWSWNIIDLSRNVLQMKKNFFPLVWKFWKSGLSLASANAIRKGEKRCCSWSWSFFLSSGPQFIISVIDAVLCICFTNPSQMIRFATFPPTFFKHISAFLECNVDLLKRLVIELIKWILKMLKRISNRFD